MTTAAVVFCLWCRVTPPLAPLCTMYVFVLHMRKCCWHEAVRSTHGHPTHHLAVVILDARDPRLCGPKLLLW